MNKHSLRIAAAIAATDPTYLAKTFEMRNPGLNSQGSVFDEPQSAKSLWAADWEPSNHPNIAAPAVGFVAAIPGMVGIVELEKLSPETPCRIELGHRGADKFVTVVVPRAAIDMSFGRTDHTTLMVGPRDKDNGDLTEVVWTFHPGAPVRPSTMPPSDATEAVKTVADAIALGFGLGKITG